MLTPQAFTDLRVTGVKRISTTNVKMNIQQLLDNAAANLSVDVAHQLGVLAASIPSDASTTEKQERK